MDWKKLLESLLPGLLQFFEGAVEAGGTGKGNIPAVVYISQHALAIVGVPLPSHDEVTSFVQEMVSAMEVDAKLGGYNPVGHSGVSRPNVGEIIQPS